MKKAVLVTGASTGIGKAACIALDRLGFLVFAGVRKESDARKLKSEGKNIQSLILDVTKTEDIQRAFETIQGQRKNYSQISLINNAGIAVSGPLEALPIEKLREQFDVNFFGLLEMTQALLPLIRETKGRIVNISSISGLTTSPFLGAYSASKFALEAASDALRRELYDTGVKVVVLEPGSIDTPIWSKGLGSQSAMTKIMLQDRVPLYEKQMDKFKTFIEAISSRALPVDKVTDALEKALTAANPPTRIVVANLETLTRVKLSRLLPDKVVDTLLNKTMTS